MTSNSLIVMTQLLLTMAAGSVIAAPGGMGGNRGGGMGNGMRDIPAYQPDAQRRMKQHRDNRRLRDQRNMQTQERQQQRTQTQERQDDQQ